MNSSDEIYLQPSDETSYGSVVDVDGACYIKTDRDPGTRTHFLSGFESSRNLTMNHKCTADPVGAFTSSVVPAEDEPGMKYYSEQQPVSIKEILSDQKVHVGQRGNLLFVNPFSQKTFDAGDPQYTGPGAYSSPEKLLLANNDPTSGPRWKMDSMGNAGWHNRFEIHLHRPITILPGRYICRVQLHRNYDLGYNSEKGAWDMDPYFLPSGEPYNDNIYLETLYNEEQGYNTARPLGETLKTGRWGIHGGWTFRVGAVKIQNGIVTEPIEGVYKLTTAVFRNGITQLDFENVIYT
jgi:hypothetical protein